MAIKCYNPWDIESKHVMAIDGTCEAIYAGERRWGGGEKYVLYPMSFERVAASFMGGQGEEARGIGYEEEVSPPLKGVLAGGNAVPSVVYRDV